jgi:GT2 family glycosyltransferase
LAQDSGFLACLESLESQTWRDFDVLVVDNGGSNAARRLHAARPAGSLSVRWVENVRNTGFGAAINEARRHSRSPFVAALNDDATASPEWLGALVGGMADADVGMCASQVRLAGDENGRLDSAGMLIAGDGSSRQRGHLEPPGRFDTEEDVLLPSASAAIYRRTALDQAGWFDEHFFLYCEDTDVGLRIRRLGWRCRYIPRAVAWHRFSRSAGRASALKAYYVERNRLFVLIKHFPAAWLAAAPFVTILRYYWHFGLMLQGKGKAAEFREGGGGALDLVRLAIRAHLSALADAGRLWRERRRILRDAAAAPGALSPKEFSRLLRDHHMKARQVAEL